jgi:glyoxylase-like metal-dependent hydrolase (beta-lactamase superfamily II)
MELADQGFCPVAWQGGTVFVKQFRTGGDRNFGYLIADEVSRQAAVVDPSYSPQAIVEWAGENGYSIEYVFCTHGHFDHTNGNDVIRKLTGKRALLFGDRDPETEIEVRDCARFPLGQLEVRVLHTPGHAPDAICLYIGDAVFTGDTLFVGKVGGTDLEAGAEAEYHSLHDKLLKLPDETRVFPGHDVGVEPASTVAHERETNPFLLRPDLDAFVDLKKNWAAYKKEHGIA